MPRRCFEEYGEESALEPWVWGVLLTTCRWGTGVTAAPVSLCLIPLLEGTRLSLVSDPDHPVGEQQRSVAQQ